jgi:hypothetical protein
MTDNHPNLLAALRQQQVDAVEGQRKAALSALAEWQKGVSALAGGIAPAAQPVPGMPDTQAMLTDYFRFAEQVLESQYEFALALLKADGTGSGTPA